MIGDRIRRLRKARGLSQTDLAGLLGLNSSEVVCNWETQPKHAPRLSSMAGLATVLGTTTDYLLTGCEPPAITALHRAIRDGASQQTLLSMIGE